MPGTVEDHRRSVSRMFAGAMRVRRGPRIDRIYVTVSSLPPSGNDGTAPNGPVNNDGQGPAPAAALQATPAPTTAAPATAALATAAPAAATNAPSENDPNDWEWGFSMAPQESSHHLPTRGYRYTAHKDGTRWVSEEAWDDDIRSGPRLLARVRIGTVLHAHAIREILRNVPVIQNVQNPNVEWAAEAFNRLRREYSTAPNHNLSLVSHDWDAIQRYIMSQAAWAYAQGLPTGLPTAVFSLLAM